jgi:hypothetical protein
VNVYIAGKFSAQARLREIRGRIRQARILVTSSWMDEVAGEYPVPRQRSLNTGSVDLREVAMAELLVLDTLDVTETGGREVEFGFALAQGTRTWLVGPVRNIFHEFAEQQFDSWDEVFVALGEEG